MSARGTLRVEARLRRMKFKKYEGLGNDFIVLDLERAEDFNRADVSDLCDRHFGIGGDGVLLVVPPSAPSADARMIVLNADGSVPEMCGNGLRCVALHLALARGKVDLDVRIETDSGTRLCVVRDGGRNAGLVRVDMGVVRVLERRRLTIENDAFDVTVVDAGNPHAVIFAPEVPRDFLRIGPKLAEHSSFPQRTNVEFATKMDDSILVAVWERGVGATLACGTGACAVVAEAAATGLVRSNEKVLVHLPGGALFVTHDVETGKTELEGPARLVFKGDRTPSP